MRGLAATTLIGKRQLAHAAMKATGAVRQTQFHRPQSQRPGKKRHIIRKNLSPEAPIALISMGSPVTILFDAQVRTLKPMKLQS
ncbi:MAG: hypothetical protein VX296_02350, partial [Pseudomonadota bacterium]|nr:hypothetical protein [Pseudomonadota bacterium]